MKLYAHQQKILDQNPKRCLLAWQTGTGKSLGAWKLATKNANKILVICPKALKEKWSRDLEEWFQKDSDKSLITAVRSKEEFRKDWDKIDKYDAIIVDEAHYFSGMKSQMSKALLAYNRKWNTEYIYLLTATPYLSTPWNIYRLAQMMGIRWNYIGFYNEFFHKIKLGKYKGAPVVTKPKPNKEAELAKYVHQIGDVVNMDECVDVPEQIFETIWFKTNKKQEQLLKHVSKIETNPAVRYTKFHQIENGSLKGNEYEEDQLVDADKHEHVLELIEENKKVAIVCRYNLQIDSLHSLINSKLKNKPVFIIRGDVQNRDEIVQQVEKCDECVILINAHCSEGYELPSVGLMIFASMSFSYKDYAQMQGRILRINKLKKNVYLHLVNSNSIDQAVYEAIMSKQDFDLEIYSKNAKLDL